jgi:hypothetical protein
VPGLNGLWSLTRRAKRPFRARSRRTNFDTARTAMDETGTTELIPYDDWLKANCVSRSAGWRYRQAGLIETINRFGRLYVTRAASDRFGVRQQSGEFARSRPINEKMARRRKPGAVGELISRAAKALRGR